MINGRKEQSLVSSMPLAGTLDALATGASDLHRYVDEVCDRIDAVDGAIHSLLVEEGRRARLHSEAEELLRRYPVGSARPSLFGALVGVKDIIHVDGFVTHAGSTVPPEAFAGAEAEVVRRLRGAGALVLGKSVTTEFAYFEPGPTRNPHNPDHTPGGSSSGSAAAVAAGIAPLALGTQTIGSVIRPAAFCGIVGYKATKDRIPAGGIVYFSPTADHVGLFTQDVAGMQRAAGVLCAGWRDEDAGAEGATVGVPEGPYLQQASDVALDRFSRVLGILQQGGVRVKSAPMLADITEINAWHRRLVFGEFARQHAQIYARYGEHYRPRTREIIEFGRGVSDDEVDELRLRCEVLRLRVESEMQSAGVDFLATPAAVGPAPAGIGATGDPNMNLPWTTTGMPAVCVPCGTDPAGLPLGVQFVARRNWDEGLLHLVRRFEADLAAIGLV